MHRQSFNHQWTVAPKAPLFAALAGPPAGKPVTLPHDALRDEPRSAAAEGGSHAGWYPGGVFEYAKAFEVPAELRDKTVAFEFEGAYRDAVVTINGEYAGHRPNGYSGFIIDADPYLRFGETNTIAVEVRSRDDSRWYAGAGLYRDVWMLTADPVHIPPFGVRITTPEIDDELAVVTAEVRVDNQTRHPRTVRVVTTILDAAGAEVASATTPLTVLAGEGATAVLRHYIGAPQRWGVDTPYLYSAESVVFEDSDPSRIELDSHTTAFGIRSLSLDPGRGLRINGETVKLRGACVHHDNGPLGAASIARAEERRIELLKSAGFNAVRSAHNSLSRAALDACDRLGMLVMDELSDMWTVSKSSYDYGLSFPEWWERDVEAIVEKDFNHPSVIMYSVGNEVPEVGKPIGVVWGRRIAEKFRDLDPTRFLTNGINGVVAAGDMLAAAAAGNGEGGQGVNDLIASLADVMGQLNASQQVSTRTEQAHAQVDIAGLNYAELRYASDGTAFPNRVIVGSETFPARLDSLWQLVKANPNIIGDFAWTGWDYLGETGIGRPHYLEDDAPAAPLGAPYPWLTASCGTIDILGVRRPISYWREIIWGLRSKPYIAVERPKHLGLRRSIGPWAWRDVVSGWTWDVPDGTPLAVEVYSPDEEIELRLNGEVIGRRFVGDEQKFIARFAVPFERGELVAIGYRAGEEVARSEIASTGAPKAISIRADRVTISASSDDLAYVEISVVDESGTFVHSTEADVTVAVEGPAELVAFGSARPDPTEGFDSATHGTFDGRALAIVRPTGPGQVTVRASSASLGAAIAAIEVRESTGRV